MRYLEKRPDGSWRYQRAVPAKLVKLVGDGKLIKRKVGHMCQRAAEEIAGQFAAADSRLFKHLVALPAHQADELATRGGWVKLPKAVRHLEFAVQDHIPEDYLLSDEPTFGLEHVADEVRLGMLAQLREQRAEAAELARVRAIAMQAEPAAEFSLDGLFALWIRVKEPKRTAEHARTLTLFKKYIGPRDYRNVTADDCRGFCDELGREGSSKIGCVKHLDNIRGMFSSAVARAVIPRNPAAGIRPDGKIVKAKRLPFTGVELAMILKQAQQTGFGGKRADAVLWALRLLVWTGARVSEILQLRKADIGTEGEVPFIHIREGHPDQSVKTGNARKVPLAPEVASFLEYTAAQPGEWIFGAFTRNATKGRATWLISSFPAFRRAHVTMDLNKTLHSIRHRFHDVLDNAGIPIERQRVLVGHASGDVHSKYGAGPNLRKLYEDVCALRPFED